MRVCDWIKIIQIADWIKFRRAQKQKLLQMDDGHVELLIDQISSLLQPKSVISKLKERNLISKCTQIVAIVTTYEIEPDNLNRLVECVQECLKHRNLDVRIGAFAVLDACLEFQLEKLHTMRQKIFDLIYHHPNDFVNCQKSINLLTCDGRNITPFEAPLGKLVLRWLTESGAQREVDIFFVNVLKRSPLALDEESVASMAHIFCSRCDAAWKVCDSESCKRFLRIFSSIVSNGYACAMGRPDCLRTLCCMVNEDGHGTWNIMKTLLKSPWGHQVLRGLLQILDNAPDYSHWILRGAVFFVGMSCWGSQRVAQLQFSWGTILPSLLSAISCDHGVAVFEVILSIQRLIKKYGSDMRVEWDIVLEILAQLRPWVSGVGDEDSAEKKYSSVASYEDETIHVNHTRIPKELLDTIQLIEDLYHKGEFHGDSQHFFQLLDIYLGYLPEPTVLLLLKYRSEEAHPAQTIQWLAKLEAIIQMYFLPSSSITANVRQQALDVLQMTMWSCKNVCEDRLIEAVVLPHLSYVYDDPVAGVRRKGLDLIIEVARQLETSKFDALLDVIENAVYQSAYPDSQLTAVGGLVSLFSSAFNHLPYSRALRMYQMITCIVEDHQETAVRRMALSCLLHVSYATKTLQLQWIDNQVRTSQFLFCSKSSLKPDRIGALVPVYRAIGALLTLVSTETSSESFYMAARGIKTMLTNSYIMMDTNADDIAMKLISCLQCKAFGRAALTDELLKTSGESRGDARQRHNADTYHHNYATAILENKHMEMGYELLLLQLGSCASRLSQFVQKQILKCFLMALDTKPIVSDGTLWVDVPTSPSLYKCPPPSPLELGTQHENKTRSVSHGFTSRVLSKLNTNSSSSSTSSKSVAEKDTTTILVDEQKLLKAEYSLRHAIYRAVSLSALIMPDEVSSILTDLLESIRKSCSNRRDIFEISLETVLNILLVDRVVFTVPRYLQVLRLAFPGIISPSKKTCVLAHKVLVQCFSRCPVPDRIHLADIALPQLQQYMIESQGSVAETAIDFISRLTYAPGDSLPHCRQPKTPRTLFFQQGSMPHKCKTWIHGNAVISITTGSLGYADITIRRASGTTQWLFQLRNHLWNGNFHPLVRFNSPFQADYQQFKTAIRSASTGKLPGPSESSTERRGASSNVVRRRTAVLNHKKRLLPLPSYDGNGGSPSLFVEKNTNSTVADLSVKDLLLHLPFAAESTEPAAPPVAVSPPPPTVTVSDVPIDPAFLMMQLHDMSHSGGEIPQLIQTGDSYSRAINVLDRTPGIDTHKIGVLYVGRKQSTETEILTNTSGSPDYINFLTELGHMVKLSRLEGYCGGLDVMNESDGEYGLVWRDDCVQAVFHVATLMRPKTTTPVVAKKRLIGNDYVHIIYSDSSELYAPETISGQFNDVHVIIHPLRNGYYRVHVHTKEKISRFGPLYGVQIIPASILATAVRLTAFNANIACQIHHEEMVEFVSNAQDRLKQIKQIKCRHSVSQAVV